MKGEFELFREQKYQNLIKLFLLLILVNASGKVDRENRKWLPVIYVTRRSICTCLC